MFEFTKLEQTATCDVEIISMGNDFSLAVLKENGETIEVCVSYKDVLVAVETTLEAAKEYI